MTRRNKIIIALLIAIIIFLILLGVVWWLNRPLPPETQTNTNNQGLQIPDGVPSIAAELPDTPSLVGEAKLEANLKTIASTFAERFGSYSNEGNFSNLDAIRDLMTVKMKAFVDDLKVSQAVSASESYYGVTTIALSTNIITFEEELGRSEIIVVTQKQEARGSTVNPRVFYQDIKLQLVKTEDGWKVDSAQWLD